MRRVRLLLALVIVSAFPLRAEAVLSHVKNASDADIDGGTTATVTFASNLTAGNTLVCAVTWSSNTITVSGVAHGTDALASAGNRTDQGTVNRAEHWYKINIQDTTADVVVTFSSGPGRTHVYCAEIGGNPTQLTGTPTGNAQTTPGTGTDAVTSGNITTTVDGCYVHGTSSSLPAGSGAINIGTGFTGAGTPDAVRGRAEYVVQSSAGAIATTFTNTNATVSNVTIAMAVCPAAGGGSTQSPFGLLGVGR